MADLEADLILNADEPLNSIDQIGAALAALASQFEADLSDALAVLGEVADESVTLSVDTQGAEEAQGDLEATGLVAQEVDGQLVVIDVSAEGAEDATEQLHEVGEASAEAESSATDAGVSLEDLGGKAGGAAVALSGAALAIGGVSLGVAGLFENSLDAQAGLESFQARTGDAAAQVETLDDKALGLNTTLGDLSLALGSDDEATRNAVARLFALGDAEGFTTDRTDALIEQIVGLAGRARALNPSLGDLGSITDSLGTRLQRGGRFVADFGISLNASEIQARALSNTGKTLASDLTILEKTEAAAQLASEQLGGSLGKDITANADNAAITFDRLKQSVQEALEPIGAPIISPLFQLLEDAGPLIEDIGSIIADVATELLDFLDPILVALEPIVDELKNDFHAAIVELSPAFTELAKSIADLVTQMEPVVDAFGDAFVEAAPGIAKFVQTLADLINVAADVVGPIARITDSLDLLSSNPLTGPLFHLGGAFGETRDAAEEAADSIDTAKKSEIDAAAATAGLSDEWVDQQIALRTAVDGTVNYSGVLNDIAIQSGITADEQANLAAQEQLAAEAATEAADGANLSATSWVTLAEAIIAGKVSAQDYQATADALGISLETLTAFVGGVNDAMDEFTSTALEKIPSVTSVVDDLDETLTASPDAIIQSLADRQKAIADFQANVAALIAFGFDDIAQLAIDRGPEFTNALVNTIRVGRPGLAQELESSLETFQGQLDQTEGFLRDTAGPALVDASEVAAGAVSDKFKETLDFEGATSDEVVRSADALLRGSPALDAAAVSAATGTTDQYGSGLDLPGATQASADESEATLRGLGLAGSTLAIAAEESGSLIGNVFAIGLGNAIVDAAAPGGFLDLQVKSAVEDLKDSAKFSFDITASVTGAPGGGGAAGGVVLNVDPGAVVVNVTGGADRSVAEEVGRAAEKGIVSAGRILLTEVRGR